MRTGKRAMWSSVSAGGDLVGDPAQRRPAASSDPEARIPICLDLNCRPSCLQESLPHDLLSRMLQTKDQMRKLHH